MNTARLNQGTPLLLNAVSKHYAENIVLNQLDLHIPAGQFVAVVGRSGCIDSQEVRKKPGGHWIIRDLTGLDLMGLASL